MTNLETKYIIGKLNPGEVPDNKSPSWPIGFIDLVKDVRHQQKLSLRESLDFISNTFGFDSEVEGWLELRMFLDRNKINLDQVRGPHAVTLMKAIKAKYTNVSTEQ